MTNTLSSLFQRQRTGTSAASSKRRAVSAGNRWISAGVGVCLALGALNADAARLYRYKNDSGTWVIASSVPNERVKLGYQVVDETGRLIEEVEPQRSPEEAAEYIAELEAKQARDENVRRINLLYGSEDDISYALSKALDSIDKSLANTQANVRQLRSQRQRLETQAARIERAGTPLSPEMIASIATLGEQIDNLEAEMRQRTNQKDVERERHARDRQLFREVHGIPESVADDSADHTAGTDTDAGR